MPSGRIEIIVHEGTFGSNTPIPAFDPKYKIECHWNRYRLPPMPVGTPFAFYALSPVASREKIESGLQAILTSGKVMYQDGFPDDPIQEWDFCFNTVFHKISKRLYLAPCDSEPVLRLLEQLDGYPNNENY
jgi:hypothetical protein